MQTWKMQAGALLTATLLAMPPLALAPLALVPLAPLALAEDAPPPAPPAAAPASVAAAPAPAAEPAPPPAKVYTASQIEEMVAPIALYPDALLMQILMAATYPLEVVQADRWRQEHKDLKGDALAKALESQTWDPSVEALTYFPDVLARMSKNLDWTTDMGNAFLAQQADVLDAIQRMRKKAYEAGNLKSTPQQTVSVAPAAAPQGAAPQGAAPQQVITVAPADPQVVYVPSYPSTAYGPSYANTPSYSNMYPPPSAYPPGYNATTNLLSFGVGMALGGLIWGNSGGCNYDTHVVYGGGGYGGGSNTNINVGNVNVIGSGNRVPWQHQPDHRRGVPYKNPTVQQRYAKTTTAQQVGRQQVRGYQPAADVAARPAAQQRPQGPRPAQGAAPAQVSKAATGRAERPATRDVKAGPGPSKRAPAAQPAAVARRDDAFSGLGNAGFDRAASKRGASSRATASSPSAARPKSGGLGGGQKAGGGGARGGGGGGRRSR